jgi:peptide/nickel transport system permease protein
VLRLTLSRLAQAVPVLVLVSVVAFGLLRLAPGDPAQIQAGADAAPETLAAIRAELALDQPLPVQYVAWAGRVVRGDLGRSYQSHQPVTQLIGERLPATAQIAAVALVLIVAVGIPLGIASALRKDSAVDQVVRVTSLLGISVPNFVIGILLVLVFGWYFPGIMPYEGYVALPDDPLESFKHTLLPSLALALAQVGIVARLTRVSMLEVIGQEYITVARAFGVSERELVWRDALRNALLPVLTMLGIISGFLLGGSVVVESVFGIAGLGRLLVESFSQRDYPVTIGVMLFIAVMFVVINLVVDLLYGVVNPRIRAGYELGQG